MWKICESLSQRSHQNRLLHSPRYSAKKDQTDKDTVWLHLHFFFVSLNDHGMLLCWELILALTRSDYKAYVVRFFFLQREIHTYEPWKKPYNVRLAIAVWAPNYSGNNNVCNSLPTIDKHYINKSWDYRLKLQRSDIN